MDSVGTPKLLAAIEQLNQTRNEPFQLSTSIGESVYDPAAPSGLEALMESADRAMYEEKKRLRSRRAAPAPQMRGN